MERLTSSAVTVFETGILVLGRILIFSNFFPKWGALGNTGSSVNVQRQISWVGWSTTNMSPYNMLTKLFNIGILISVVYFKSRMTKKYSMWKHQADLIFVKRFTLPVFLGPKFYTKKCVNRDNAKLTTNQRKCFKMPLLLALVTKFHL